MKRNSWIGETYKTYLGAFGARSLDDIFYFIGKKNLSVATLLEKVNPKKQVSLITYLKSYKEIMNKEKN